uniref:CCAAT-binding factor domain-containing protein n=1 Tax=Tetradesmus obliquus TaxID=3088 RepID=A0A383VK77_TETOB
MAKDKDKQEKPVKVDPDALRAEVKAFAAELGFGTGAVGAFEYDDFAPEKAAKKIKPTADAGKQTAKQQQQQQQQQQQSGKGQRDAGRNDKPAAVKQPQQDRGSKQKAGREQQQQQQQQQEPSQLLSRQEQNLDIVRSRTWVESVGPRPGEARGKSLLGKDEPAIWYEAAAALEPLPAPPPAAAAAAAGGKGAAKAGKAAAAAGQLDFAAADAIRTKAEGLLEREAALFEREMAGRNAADSRWLAQVRRSGTTADKVAAMSLLVSSSAAASLKSLDGLLTMMAKSGGGRQVVVAALEALQELFLTQLLPDRKLKVLESQPLGLLPPGREGERRLLLWAVEDAVKSRYAQYVQLLEKASTDNLDFIKEKALKAISRLLAAKPEGEQALLAALVNKLGDPSRKLASDAAYMLGQLLLQHPAMKPVVVREVERFVFRPGLAERGRYYAVTFLNQLPLSHRPQEGGTALAQKLVDIYFSLFRLLLEGRVGNAAVRQQQAEEAAAARKGKGRWRDGGKAGKNGGKQAAFKSKLNRKKQGGGGDEEDDSKHVDGGDAASQAAAGELDSRMLSALITGVRRAFPYVDSEKVEPLIEAHSEALFRLVHTAPFTVALQHSVTEVEPLIEAHSEALFRLVHTAPFTVALQALMLMHQLLSGRNAVSDRFYRALYAVLLAEGARGAAGARAPQFMSLLVKAMKADVSVKRVAAFAKRLLQVACHAPSNWAAGALLLLSEVLRAQPGLWAAVQQPEDAAGQAETFTDAAAADGDGAAAAAAAAKAAAAAMGYSDDEEVFRDALDSEDGEEGAAQQAQKKKAAGGSKAAAAAANGAAANGEAANGAAPAAAAAAGKWPRSDYYDMRKREPAYALAEVSCWWELLLLAKHGHPSVAAFARSLLAGSPVEYGGDPLRDLNLPAFLDKFVAKKPKAVARGSSLMQPTHTLAAAAAAAGSEAAAAAVTPDVSQLSSAAFAALAEADIGADQLFFHRFFNLQSVKAKQAAAAKAKAARAAAAAAAGLGDMAGLEEVRGEDEDEEPGEFGRHGEVHGEDDLDDAEVDHALAEAEGVGDDELGDPDIGWDYEQLMAAMEGDDAEGSSSSDDDEPAAAAAAAAAGGSEGESEEAGEGDDEEDEAGSSSGGSEEEDDGSGSGSSSSDNDGSSSDGEGWVMMEGAEQALQGGNAAAAAGSKEKKQKKRKLQAAAGDVADDAELVDINPLDLPSPSSSSEDGQQQQQQGRKKQKQQQQQADDSADDDDDLDLDMDDIMGGSDDAGDDEAAGFGDDVQLDSDEEPAAAAAAGGSSKQKRGRAGKGGGALFAAADGYEDYFAEYEKVAAAAEQKDGAAAAEPGEGAAGPRGGKQGKRRQQQQQQQDAGGGKQRRQSSSGHGKRRT